MSTGEYTPARKRAVDLLVRAGTWVSRAELSTLSTCVPAVDDALADLIVEGVAEYRENVGYRLAGTPAARRAAQLMAKSGRRAAAVGVPGPDFYRVGVAEQRAQLGLLMYELALPNPEPGPAALQKHLAQVEGVIAFVNSRGEANATGE